MIKEKISAYLSLGRTARILFEESADNYSRLGLAACGLLNSSGGYIVCGVNSAGDIAGIAPKQDTIAELEKMFIAKISPKAFISVQQEQVDDKYLLVIEVPSGKDVPYAFDNVIYISRGDSIEKADAAAIRDIVMRQQTEPERWERRFSAAEMMQDTDLDEIAAAVDDATRARRAFFRHRGDPLMVLEDFSVAKYGRLTNAGDVLFGNNPAMRLPQTRIRAIAYLSDKAGDAFADMKSFEGPLHAVFLQAYSFIVRNTPTQSRFAPGNPKRQDSPLYPEEAVREALINALAHRDYSAASGGVSIHVYPRKMEIWNSGELPEGVTQQSLLNGQISVLRNPDIAHVLYLRGLMEKAGRGSVLMVQKCRQAGLPDPVWRSERLRGVTVTFTAPEVTPEVAPEVTPEVTPEVERLLHVVDGEMSGKEMMAALGLRDEKHFRLRYRQAAMDRGLIEMTLPEKPNSRMQRYRLTEAGRAWKQR